tara:strand:- start:1812 stop:3059 length:1248 start_codon:yes stop_codon:yes gene_type:complete
MDYAELHMHTYYSIQDGLCSPEAMVKRAKQLGMKYLAITDHGNIDGWISFQQACKEHDIIPILGCEFYIVEDHKVKPKSDPRKHMIVLPKSQKGLQNIMKMLTIANLDGFHRAPRIDPQIFLDHCEDLVVSTACLGSFTTTKWGKKFFMQLIDIMKDDLYLETHGNKWTGQREHNDMMYKQHLRTGVKMVVCNDAHYSMPEDSLNQEMLLCLSSMKWNRNNTWDSPDRWKFESDTHFLKTGDSMIKAFRSMKSTIPEDVVIKAIGNTMEIAEKCGGILLEEKPINLPLIPQCEEGKEAEFFKKLIKDGFKKVVLDKNSLSDEQIKIYRDRLTEEFKLIESKGFIRYFLIVWELIEWCRNNGVAVGTGRGSVAGSLIAYVTGITRLADPIKHGLLFERFLSESRSDMPDFLLSRAV